MMANRTMILEDETEYACHSCGDLFPACEMHEALGAWICLEDKCLCEYIEHLEHEIQLLKDYISDLEKSAKDRAKAAYVSLLEREMRFARKGWRND